MGAREKVKRNRGRKERENEAGNVRVETGRTQEKNRKRSKGTTNSSYTSLLTGFKSEQIDEKIFICNIVTFYTIDNPIKLKFISKY